ncbi:MAG: hypothetical protein DWQ47_08235 [Acidobacteria bacterium]|nr:MAG: hypothetical protein DWQ32_16335 [Acidobacteriota bacterium]REJ99101.1 MAG: hypothetical protein DWQ38_13640 [Acidobacteriota bacterium]REK16178.1 MAG: hypothetical protein DWQ43_04045 [Acidobacteriota bacterium]REK43859.1 MAG: hypothetical protein DWQ47_08235 [Acidobacteriota bacterium]
MFRLILRLTALVFAVGLTSATVHSQECKPPEIVFNKDSGNIFTEEQEMYLGDAIAEQIQRDFRILEDPEVNAFLDRVGDRLIRHLPPTSLKFRFFIVDIPEVNAFAMPGGRIFVTRKLIAFVRSEDELAGILAHELGHGIVRHGAQDLSKVFREVLKIDSFTDRADVFAKYNELLDRQNTKRVRRSSGHEGDQQMEADRIGVFAMTAAGYDPAAFTSAFDRLFETEGKTGSWFSDLFGATKPEQKRLREILDAVKEVPKECVERESVGTQTEFEDWQAEAILISSVPRTESVSAVIRRNLLNPRLRDQIRHLEFSPDGKSLIAQDDSTIFVLKTSPFEIRFRIDAPEAEDANFTPDSRSVVFSTPGLRVEKWDVASGEAELIREVYLNRECIQTALSPDGSKLVCVDTSDSSASRKFNVKVFDVATNKLLLERKDIFSTRRRFMSFNQLFSSFGRLNRRLLEIEFTPSGRYIVLGAGEANVLDLSTGEEVKLGGNLDEIMAFPFAFISNDLIIGQDDKKMEDSGVFQFPSGRRLEKFDLFADSLERPHQGNYVLVRPIKTAAVGVFDLSTKKFLLANNNPALAVHGNVFVSENKDGVLGLYRLDKDETIATLELPDSRLGGLRALDVSPDLNWLAVSNDERGAVWSLYSGKRLFYVEPFSAAYFDKTGKIFADFGSAKDKTRRLGIMNLADQQLQNGRELPGSRATQFGKYLVTYDYKGAGTTRIDVPTDIRSGVRIISMRNDIDTTFQLRALESNEVIWEHEFKKVFPRSFFDSFNENISFVLPASGDSAKEIYKDSEPLKQKAKELGDKDGDYFVHVVEAGTGKVLGQTFIETGEGSFRILEAEAVGDYLGVADSENRVQVFSLSTGDLLGRFFGRNFAINKEDGTLAIGNLSGKLNIYDIRSGRVLEQMSFTSPIAYAVFGKYGKKLLVLTTDQEALILDTTRFGQ